MEQNNTNTIIKCRYAGDPNDEACIDCNGISFVEKDAKGVEHVISCTECGGYEESEPTNEPAPTQKPDTAENINSKPPQPEVNVATINNTTEQENCEISGDNAPITPHTNATNINNTDILEITAGYGTSIEVNGVWHRIDYSEKRKVDPTRDINTQRNDLWDDVIDQVFNLVDEAKKGSL